MTHFASPWFLLFALAVPVLIFIYVYRGKGRGASMVFSNASLTEGLPRGWRVRFRHLPFALFMVGITLLSIAAARPQSGRSYEKVNSEGIDIMLLLDVSGSMLAEDFQPHNRLYVSKQVISEFVSGRKGDRIGLVLFAGKAFTQCPLTTDYEMVASFLERAEQGMIEDGTAIGMAIATATNRLRESKGKSRVMILLTDGVNNRGEIDPVTAAKLAATQGIKIYAIGAGTNGYAPIPVQDSIFGTRRARMKVEIDDKTLSDVAEATGGRYFRATDSQALKTIYEKIDKLEKTDVELEHYTEYTEHFAGFALLGFLAIMFGLIADATVLRKVS